MEFTTKVFKEPPVVSIQTPQKFTIEISEWFRNRLKELVDSGNYNIVIDMTQTDYMDSSGLGAIVSRISATRAQNGDIRIANPKDFVTELFDVTNLNQILKIFPTVDDAVSSFQ